MPPARARDRFAAFCGRTGRSAMPADSMTIVAWLESERPAGRAAARWTADIRAAHLSMGYDDPCAGQVAAWVRRARNPATRSALPPGEVASLASLIPVAGWPGGLHGRRDRLAFILHQLGAIPARVLVTLRAADIAVTGHAAVTVMLGSPVTLEGPAGYPAACPACAAVRWAWVLRRAADLNRPAITHGLRRPPPGPSAHVCVPMEAAGPSAWPLFPGADQWGHFALPPVPAVSVRAMEGILRATADGRGAYRDRPARRGAAPPAVRDPSAAPVPAPQPANAEWYREGLAARARDRRMLQEASSRLGELDAAAAELEGISRRILEQVTDNEDS